MTATPPFPDTIMMPFTFYIREESAEAPLTLDVRVASARRALELAQERLARSPAWLTVEVWQGGNRLFTLERPSA